MDHYQSALDNSVESGPAEPAYDTESLPSYTLVSGLPSYDDALDCYRKTQTVSTTPRPSLMRLFSFDNSLLSSLGKESTAHSEDELQQVVVEPNKDGLPSYQESLAVITGKKVLNSESVKIKLENSEEEQSISDKIRKDKKVLKALSKVAVYDDDYWSNVHLNQNLERIMSPSCSSNSLPRSFTTIVVASEA